MEREARRHQRELEKRQKELARMEELERAKYEVEVYENYLDVLKSIHKDCSSTWNWKEIKSSNPPDKPTYQQKNELQAKNALDNYTPTLFAKIFGNVEKKKATLLENIEAAKEIDKVDYEKACEDYREKYDEWKKLIEIAEGIIDGSGEAYLEAIKEVNLFEEIQELGSSIGFKVINKNSIIANLNVHSEKVVPPEVKSLLKSGKLSAKPMPMTKFYELYQDYVCGGSLRVARELFALLPIEMIIVNAIGNLLDTKTGRMEDTPILSVGVPRETLQNLNLNAVDPSDSMKNFVHRMNFKKGIGFNPVEVLNPSDFQK
jgi:hypothetical protein